MRVKKSKRDRLRIQLGIPNHPITKLTVLQRTQLVCENRRKLSVTSHRNLDSRLANRQLRIRDHPFGTKNVVLRYTLIWNRISRRRPSPTLIAYEAWPIVQARIFQVIQIDAQLQFCKTHCPFIDITSTHLQRHQRWIQRGQPLYIFFLILPVILKQIRAQHFQNLHKQSPTAQTTPGQHNERLARPYQCLVSIPQKLSIHQAEVLHQ